MYGSIDKIVNMYKYKEQFFNKNNTALIYNSLLVLHPCLIFEERLAIFRFFCVLLLKEDIYFKQYFYLDSRHLTGASDFLLRCRFNTGKT